MQFDAPHQTTLVRAQRAHRFRSGTHGTVFVGLSAHVRRNAFTHPGAWTNRGASRTGEPFPYDSIHARYIWFATHSLFTVESLWTLVGEDERWERTLEALLRPHCGYIQQGVLGCDAFDPDFCKFLKSRFPELKCAPS
jgi:hypothetical protein